MKSTPTLSYAETAGIDTVPSIVYCFRRPNSLQRFINSCHLSSSGYYSKTYIKYTSWGEGENHCWLKAILNKIKTLKKLCSNRDGRKLKYQLKFLNLVKWINVAWFALDWHDYIFLIVLTRTFGISRKYLVAITVLRQIHYKDIYNWLPCVIFI